MADSPKDAGGQYARPATRRASRLQIALWGGLLVAALVALFVSLGLWQWKKAETKTALQADLDTRSQAALVQMPATPAPAESLRFRRLSLQGEYDAAHQVLIDNRTHQERAGYHVVTPLKLAGSDMHILVNRGWVPAPADHSVIPAAPVPVGAVAITGIAVVPGNRFFTLAPPLQSGWQPVWQNLDLAALGAALPYPLQPVVIQLDAAAPGGYVRDWPRPDERADRHLSYALQWFAFAFTSLAIWGYFLLRRP